MGQAKTVDEYIRNAGLWRAEIRELRKILRSAGLTETMKWGAPCYCHDGSNVVGIGAFKSYFGLWFFQGALLEDGAGVLVNAQEGKTRALRQWRMQSRKDIRATLIKRYVREAMQLAMHSTRVDRQAKRALRIPPELAGALARNKSIAARFAALTPGRRREYAEYVGEAKRATTRARRVEKILPMIGKGKGLNDRYR